MNRSQPKKATTAGIAAAIFALIERLLTSKNPLHVVAGLLIVAGAFYVCLVDAGLWELAARESIHHPRL